MENLKLLREQKGLLQKEVAEAIGVNRTTYVKYERGDSEPSFQILNRLADYFTVSVDYLLGRDDQQKKPTVEDDGLSDRQRAFMESVRSMSPEDLDLLESLIAVVKKQKE